MTKIGGVLLAAGRSSRMGGELKQLLPASGVPLAQRCAEVLLEGGISPLVVVIPPQNEALRSAFGGMDVIVVENIRHGEGMSSSLLKGIEFFSDHEDGVVIALGDMPLLRPGTIRLLSECYQRSGKNIVFPVYGGKRGHPVIFNLKKYRSRLNGLQGDAGAREILEENPGDLLGVEVDDMGVVFDIDTPEDLGRYLEKKAGEK